MSAHAPHAELEQLLSGHADGTLCLARVDHIDSIQQADDAEHFPAEQLQSAFLDRLNSCLPEKNTVYGLALGEFAWVLDVATDQDVVNDELLALFQSPFDYDHHTAFVTLSIAVVDISIISNRASSLLQLDQALRNAQAQGGNRCYRARAPRDILSQIPSAIEREEFVVYFQGVWRADTHELSGAEALLRWHGLELNNIDPGQLVQMAEQGNKMASLGNWVIRKACSHASAWLETWAHPLTLGVNVSQQQFHSPNFISNLAICLEDTWLDPKCLELEIRYCDLTELFDRDSSSLLILSKMGVRICADNVDAEFFEPQNQALRDFVLGSASLPGNTGSIPGIRVSSIKFDPTLIIPVFSSNNPAPLTSALKKQLGEFVDKCKQEKIHTTAVGIENNDIKQGIKGFGFDFAQGYVLGKPTNAKEFTHFARTAVHQQCDPD